MRRKEAEKKKELARKQAEKEKSKAAAEAAAAQGMLHKPNHLFLNISQDPYLLQL